MKFPDHAQIFSVGGSVRDERLGQFVRDRDFVVLGLSPQDMLDLGFKQVGKSFGVFLHPQTQEEYALPRSSGLASMSVESCSRQQHLEALKEDLRCRDLTINAMAMDEKGQLFDPWGGHQDLEQGYLRHVSEAFAEDPIRILRLARFAARYHGLGFKVHPETLIYVQQLVTQGHLDHLPKERVWAEWEKALSQHHGSVFMDVLHELGALRVLAPELDVLYGVPQPAEHHPEIDTAVHVGMVMDQAFKRHESDHVARIMFAAQLHDLGKGLTQKDLWPKHWDHEKQGIPLVQRLCDRLGAPRAFTEAALDACAFHLSGHQSLEVKATTLVKMMMQMDAFRKPHRWYDFIETCYADASGRLGLENRPYPQRAWMSQAFEAARAVRLTLDPDPALRPSPERLQQDLYQLRVSAVKQAKRAFTLPDPSHSSHPPQLSC